MSGDAAQSVVPLLAALALLSIFAFFGPEGPYSHRRRLSLQGNAGGLARSLIVASAVGALVLFFVALPPATRVFNVMDYGAHRDNVTDDSPHVQAAVDAAAAAGGGIVYLPAGNYCFDTAHTINSDLYGNVELKNGVYIRGAGQTATFIRSTRAQANVFGASQKRNIGVSELTTTAATQDGCKIYACSQVTIDHVTAHDMYNGISLSGCNDSTISNCIAYNCSNIGITANVNPINMNNPDGKWCDSVVISDCEAYNCAVRGFGVNGQVPTSAHPRRCNGVTFIRCNAHNNGCNFFLSYAGNVTMIDCTATNGDTNVRIAGVQTALVRGNTYSGRGGTAAFIVTQQTDPTQYAVYGASTAITEEPR